LRGLRRVWLDTFTGFGPVGLVLHPQPFLVGMGVSIAYLSGQAARIVAPQMPLAPRGRFAVALAEQRWNIADYVSSVESGALASIARSSR